MFLLVGDRNRVTAVHHGGTQSQKWCRDGSVIRSVENQTQCLDIVRRNSSPGAQVITFEYRNQLNQKWRYQIETFVTIDK